MDLTGWKRRRLGEYSGQGPQDLPSALGLDLQHAERTSAHFHFTMSTVTLQGKKLLRQDERTTFSLTPSLNTQHLSQQLSYH